MGYRLSPAADLDLDDIYDFGITEFGQRVANAYLDSLIDCFNSLAENPRICRVRNEIQPAVRICPHGSHLVFYEVDDANSVLILRIRHGRENWHDEDK
jgi:toxin ParE1/3/4